MKNFKVFDWLLILGLLGALVVAAGVVSVRVFCDCDAPKYTINPTYEAINAENAMMLSALPQGAYVAINAELVDLNQDMMKTGKSAIYISDIYRGVDSWCVLIYWLDDGPNYLVLAYPEAGRVYIAPQAAYGCDAPPN